MPKLETPGNPTRYSETDWSVSWVVELLLDVVGVDARRRPRSPSRRLLVGLDLRDLCRGQSHAVSTAAASVWTWETAAVPVSVPLRIASRSSCTVPIAAWLIVALLGVSFFRSVCSVWKAL